MSIKYKNIHFKQQQNVDKNQKLLKKSDCHIITCAHIHTPSQKGMKERESLVLKFLPLLVGLTAINFISVTTNVISLASLSKRSKHQLSQAVFKKKISYQTGKTFMHSLRRKAPNSYISIFTETCNSPHKQKAGLGVEVPTALHQHSHSPHFSKTLKHTRMCLKLSKHANSFAELNACVAHAS